MAVAPSGYIVEESFFGVKAEHRLNNLDEGCKVRCDTEAVLSEWRDKNAVLPN
jgi:hypothetical protein